MSVHILQLATHDSKYSCNGEVGTVAAGGDDDSRGSGTWVSGGDAAVVVKAVVGGQVIRRSACVLPPVEQALCAVRRAVAIARDVCGGMRH